MAGHPGTPPATDVRERPAGLRQWWLALTADDVDVCDDDPEFPVTVAVTSSLRVMTAVWRGDTTWAAALRSGQMRIDGPAHARRALPGWFRLSMFAATPRP